MSRRIELSYLYPHSVERVWRALTDRDALARWFMNNDFAPVVGHRFTFETDPAPGFDGIISCEVLEVDPPRTLRFSWKGGPVDTVVTWSLTPDGDSTRFRMTQEGFEGPKPFLVSLLLKSGGKKLYGARLRDFLDGVAPPNDDQRCWTRRTRLFRWLATRFTRDER